MCYVNYRTGVLYMDTRSGQHFSSSSVTCALFDIYGIARLSEVISEATVYFLDCITQLDCMDGDMK